MNPTFYPITKALAKRMRKKIIGHPRRFLEPSAGKGHLIKEITKKRWREVEGHGFYDEPSYDISAIEKDEEFQAILRGKRIKVIDSDFLEFSGPDKFDLIIANPPFDHGDLHLLKAIDIMYRGQIIFLLNAETLRNPYTNTRKLLARKLKELDAEIEYIEKAFEHAERKAEVDVALVDIVIKNKIEDELFEGCEKADNREVEDEELENRELITGRRIHDLVAEHNDVVRIATETILAYFKNYPKISKYIGLNKEPTVYSSADETMTAKVQGCLNATVQDIRKDFWRKTLKLPEVTRRLTESKEKEFHQQVEDQCQMAFTERNIRQFILNLINGFDATLLDAIMKLFDKFTIEHCYRGPRPDEQNIHYFNGWKTNHAYKVRKKVIIPVSANAGWGGPFQDYGSWRLSYQALPELRDIDIVMNYFDGMKPNYYSIAEALEHSFKRNENKTESTYFCKIIAYKKGTLHLTFADEDILRRFNIEACRGKGWLPEDYGVDHFGNLDAEHQEVVEAFEGRESYVENFGRIGMNCPEMKAIEEPKKGQLQLFEAA